MKTYYGFRLAYPLYLKGTANNFITLFRHFISGNDFFFNIALLCSFGLPVQIDNLMPKHCELMHHLGVT